MLNRIRRFVDESYSELKKVTWPTREQTRNLTVLVFVISAAVATYVFIFDTIFTQVLNFINASFGS